MKNMYLVLSGILTLAVSGLPALITPRRPKLGQGIGVLFFCAGSLIGLAGALSALFSGGTETLRMPWLLPWGAFHIGLDAVNAFFLLIVFFIPMLASIYSLSYWPQSEHRENGKRLGVFFGLLAAGMAMVVIARDGVLLLVAWEVMALSAFFVSAVEDEKADVRKAGWIYLVATHAGTLFLLPLLALWKSASGSFSLEQVASIPAGTANALFLLALLGFGFKAGFMPLHIWLPGAHGNAPSHVSAVMSGVMLKMGIYGIIRMLWMLPKTEAWWGIALLVVGAVSAFAGILFSLGQRDIKRALAYSSVENIGIIGMALGLAVLGKALSMPVFIVLGFGAVLFHTLNHSLFKSLLFLNAGAVIHATGTRDMELLGGLQKKMPKTALLFFIGALAISGLPPLNGFAGEFILYTGFFRSLSGTSGGAAFVAVTAAVLCIVGALAVAAFVRVFATVFLGEARSQAVSRAHEPGFGMLAPMFALAFFCAGFGLFPGLVTRFLDPVISAWAAGSEYLPGLRYYVDFRFITYTGFCLLGLVVMGLIVTLVNSRRHRASGVRGTWDCGYSKPTPRMQYTGASLAQNLTALFRPILRPHKSEVRLESPFPEKENFAQEVPDAVLDRSVLPVSHRLQQFLKKANMLQQGQTCQYVLYIGIIVAVLYIVAMIGG